jgi:hypothetical protein
MLSICRPLWPMLLAEKMLMDLWLGGCGPSATFLLDAGWAADSGSRWAGADGGGPLPAWTQCATSVPLLLISSLSVGPFVTPRLDVGCGRVSNLGCTFWSSLDVSVLSNLLTLCTWDWISKQLEPNYVTCRWSFLTCFTSQQKILKCSYCWKFWRRGRRHN